MKFIAILVLLWIRNPSSVHAQQPTPFTYSYSAHARKFITTTFGAQALLSAVASASLHASFNASPGWGDDFHRYENHLEAYLVRRTIQQSIEYGAGTLLKQDGTFVTSQAHGFRKRLNAALYHSFFVPGPRGMTFAYPRVAAAVGTAVIADQWHPWRDRNTNPYLGVSFLLSGYVAKSIWREFKPDEVSSTRRILRFN